MMRNGQEPEVLFEELDQHGQVVLSEHGRLERNGSNNGIISEGYPITVVRPYGGGSPAIMHRAYAPDVKDQMQQGNIIDVIAINEKRYRITLQ